MFRYTDDILSKIYNSKFAGFDDRIYSTEVKIKDTTNTTRSASHLDMHLQIDNEGRLTTKLYDRRDHLHFLIVNFSFICSNIPTVHTYRVYLFQLIGYSRACGSYQDFLERMLLLTKKLLNKVAILVKCISSLREFYGRRHCLDNRYGISVTNDHGYVVYTFFLFPLVILLSVC